ncbi:hypothetical protein ASF34_01325 [Methylobacterium sp. Leaf106]|nr:hypothetical protein ASF34_01325 [Methylobacterium sp. Leaf106]
MKIEPADTLYGLEAIAAHLGITRGQAKHRVAQKLIPSFKLGRTVCALRSAINDEMRSRAEATRPNRG